MAEEKEKKRKRASGAPAQAANTQNLKAGEMLRHARIAKGLELEEISSAIHVRVGQLKAIEENHLDQLPGMTYALGFVKSYATYLKIDAVEVANKFKAENGAAQPKSVLQNQEPIGHSKMPDPFILGAAGVGVLVILIISYIFSGSDDNAREIATNIPAAPALAEAPSLPVVPPPVAEPVVETAAATSDAPAPIATGPLTTPVTPVKNVAAQPPVATPAQPEQPVQVSASPRTKPEVPAAAQPQAQPATATPSASAPIEQPPEGPINVKSSRGRVALKATQQSWVQISEGRNIVFKKVLQPGETYYVPDGTSYSMVTSNAGGLQVYIDGVFIKSLGNKGDIVRGLKLQPDILKRNRPRKNNFSE